MREDAVFAGTQQKGLLQQLDAFAHRIAIGKGAEVFGFLVEAATVKGETGKAIAGQHDVGVGLIVAKEDVVLRRQFLD